MPRTSRTMSYSTRPVARRVVYTHLDSATDRRQPWHDPPSTLSGARHASIDALDAPCDAPFVRSCHAYVNSHRVFAAAGSQATGCTIGSSPGTIPRSRVRIFCTGNCFVSARKCFISARNCFISARNRSAVPTETLRDETFLLGLAILWDGETGERVCSSRRLGGFKLAPHRTSRLLGKAITPV